MKRSQIKVNSHHHPWCTSESQLILLEILGIPENPGTGDTIPEKLSNVVDALTGEEDARKSIPGKTQSFVEEVAEYAGRLYGSAKSVVKGGAKTTKDEAVKFEESATAGWNKGEEEATTKET